MALDVQHMSTSELIQSLESARLEQQYEAALRQAERIYEEERCRALRVQLLIADDENDDLREQISSGEDEMHKLEQTNDGLYEQLAAAEADFQASQIDLKTYLRDMDRYKAEINALNAASSDSTKLLSEKLALSREMAALRPELEHLKSQAATQQNVLAEKLALERELSTAQVELENEKRAVQRMKAQDKTAGHGESVMIDEIEELKKELTKEKRSVQKQEREHMKKATEWDSQKEVMEGKLEAFRNKLRTTKEQLKEAQDELEKVQTAKFAQAAEATKARMSGVNPKKRNVARFDPDMTIGTPGNGGPAKRQRTSILPGDKSSFSITPFLNKTMSILPESPEDQTNADHEKLKESKQPPGSVKDSEAENEIQAPKAVTKKAAAAKKSTSAATTKPKASQPLKESTNPKANKAIKKPSLPKVTEEQEDEPGPETFTVDQSENPDESATTAAAATTTTLIQKKKLLSNNSSSNRPTIFDEDEDAAPKRTKAISTSLMSKKLNLSGLRNNGSSIGIGGGKLGLPGKNKVLADFSPLKKDRRGVVA